jgi:hypothetical protein
VSTREVYRNVWMTVREAVVRRPDGSMGIYGVIDKPDFAVVVPYGHSSQGCDLCLATELTLGPPEREITEPDLVHRWFSEADFRRIIRDRDIVDAATIATYGYLLLDREG